MSGISFAFPTACQPAEICDDVKIREAQRPRRRFQNRFLEDFQGLTKVQTKITKINLLGSFFIYFFFVSDDFVPNDHWGSCCARFGPISVTCRLNEVDDIDPDAELWEEKDDRPFTSALNAVTG